MWISLDNEAVVNNVKEQVERRGTNKTEIQYLWSRIKEALSNRTTEEGIKVTWTKGHATSEDVDNGVCTEEAGKRNNDVDKEAG